jgi:hypothetical protein
LISTSIWRHDCGSIVDRLLVGHVHLDRQRVVAQFGGQRLEAVHAARRQHHLVAVFHEGARHLGAETGRGAGDENDHGQILKKAKAARL